MSPASPSRTHRPSRRAAGFGALAAAAILVSGCYRAPVASDYDDLGREYFVDGCSEIVTVGDDAVTREDLAAKDDCICVFNALKNDNNLPWDALVEYEEKIAAADEGDPRPEPPKALVSAIEKCTTTGPVPSEAEGDGESDEDSRD